MQENIEVNNPMYIQDDIDDEDIHLDRAFPLQEKVRHFQVGKSYNFNLIQYFLIAFWTFWKSGV